MNTKSLTALLLILLSMLVPILYYSAGLFIINSGSQLVPPGEQYAYWQWVYSTNIEWLLKLTFVILLIGLVFAIAATLLSR